MSESARARSCRPACIPIPSDVYPVGVCDDVVGDVVARGLFVVVNGTLLLLFGVGGWLGVEAEEGAEEEEEE